MRTIKYTSETSDKRKEVMIILTLRDKSKLMTQVTDAEWIKIAHTVL